MRYLPDGTIRFSPTDLTQFLESRFASWMSRYALDHADVKHGGPRVGSSALRRRGHEHEARVLAQLREKYGDIAEIDAKADGAARRTVDAMHAGVPVIYQACLERGPFGGEPDFLIRTEGESGLGAFHYVVWDAKLARRAKPSHLVQLCSYAEMLEGTQGRCPERVWLALGDSHTQGFRVSDFIHFYRRLRADFVEWMEHYDEARLPLPDTGANHRDWAEHADRVLLERDHLSRVATITRSQVAKLSAIGIETLSALAESRPERVPGIGSAVVARLTEQAALQRRSEGRDRPLFRVLESTEVEPGKGLSLLPPPSAGDIFFDLEGDPLEPGGLEYLWGAVYLGDDGVPAYRDWWAHDLVGERAAFEALIDWLTDRWRSHPDLHVYHYGAYEVTALKRIAGREASREAELDALLRGLVFVDLYAVVRGGLRIGEASYSLKNVERLYRPSRSEEAGVATGLESLEVYEEWRESDESSDWRDSPLLADLRRYNEEDCHSTKELADWLRRHQVEAGVAYQPPKEGSSPDEAAEENPRRRAQRELAQTMLAEIASADERRAEDADRWRVHELLAQLVQFHHREMRPTYWELFARAALSFEEQAEQPDCLAGCSRTKLPPERPSARSRSSLYEYRFDPEQDTKVGEDDTCRFAEHPFLEARIEQMDADKGRLLLKVSDKALEKQNLTEPPASTCLIRFDHRGTSQIEDAISAIADEYRRRRVLPASLTSLLSQQTPAVRGHLEGPLRREGEALGDAFLRVVRNLERSTLCVQGPPGSGKTTNGARVISNLIEDGLRVGITSNSHKAILHLMATSEKEGGGGLRAVKVGGDAEEVAGLPWCEWERDSKNAAGWLGTHPLVGGTAWVFCRDEMIDQLDLLFVDEAGQVSLANLVAMARCARSLVLLGDQQQLAQPTRGVHPGESGLSTLVYALAGYATIPPERGLFLEDSWRLHPEICDFISDSFYEGRLRPAPGNEKRVLLPHGRGSSRRLDDVQAGIHFLPVAHEGNRQASDEEVEAIGTLIQQLLGRAYTDREGKRCGELGLDDILIVAPYNLQVRSLRAALPAGARIGTVDKFQGQQAPVVLVSMCASDARDSSRGLEFLLSPNRLNVALSRAECLAIVVGEERLAVASADTVRQMALVNRMCRLVERRGSPATPARRH